MKRYHLFLLIVVIAAVSCADHQPAEKPSTEEKPSAEEAAKAKKAETAKLIDTAALHLVADSLNAHGERIMQSPEYKWQKQLRKEIDSAEDRFRRIRYMTGYKEEEVEKRTVAVMKAQSEVGNLFRQSKTVADYEQVKAALADLNKKIDAVKELDFEHAKKDKAHK